MLGLKFWQNFVTDLLDQWTLHIHIFSVQLPLPGAQIQAPVKLHQNFQHLCCRGEWSNQRTWFLVKFVQSWNVHTDLCPWINWCYFTMNFFNKFHHECALMSGMHAMLFIHVWIQESVQIQTSSKQTELWSCVHMYVSIFLLLNTNFHIFSFHLFFKIVLSHKNFVKFSVRATLWQVSLQKAK